MLALGHENGNESQQENENCANNGNDDGNVLDNSFNRILRFVRIIVCGHEKALVSVAGYFS